MYDGPKVFLSSTSLDLSEYRDAILKGIAETEWLRCIAQENFGIAPAYPRDVCLDRVQRSDLFVALVGHYRGSEIEGDNRRRSFTELEYDAAINNRKPRFIAVQPDDHAGVQPRFVSRGELGDRQDAFRRRVMNDGVVGLKFGSTDKVAGQIVNALWRHFAIRRALAGVAPPTGDQQQETTAAFARALGEIAEEQIVDLESLAKGTAGFDRKRTIDELTRRGEALVAEADTDARPKRREAARHFCQIGALAGLGDPKSAREAYARAVALDPEDRESLYWQGYLALLAHDLGTAEVSLAQLLALSETTGDTRGLVRARFRLSQVIMARGRLDSALELAQQALTIATTQATLDPEDHNWQQDLSESQIRLGVVLVERGNLAEASAQFRSALKARERLCRSDPGNMGWQRDLSVSYERVGAVLVDQGNLPEAMKSFRASLAIRDHLAKSDPDNAGLQHNLSSSYINLGSALRDQGNLPEALKSFRDSLAIRDRLAKSDPDNAGLQHDVYTALWFVADVEIEQGKLSDALVGLERGRKIMEVLAKGDPGNAEILFGLSLSHRKIAAAQMIQGNRRDALKSYHNSLAIASELTARDPRNTNWQWHRAVLNCDIGSVQRGQGNLNAALDSFMWSVADMERLTNADPNNALWQRDLALGHGLVAEVLAKQGNREAARERIIAGRKLIARLKEQSPDNATLPKDLAVFDFQLAQLDQSVAE